MPRKGHIETQQIWQRSAGGKRCITELSRAQTLPGEVLMNSSADPLNVAAWDHDGCYIIGVRGEIDLNTAPTLERSLRTAIDASTGNDLVIDLSKVAFMDARGLTVLVRIRQYALATGHPPVKLAAPTYQVWRILRIAGLDRSFTILLSPVVPSSSAAPE
jgi:anti-anti-sigma factor